MQRIIDLQPARATVASAAYPDGSAKNETSSGANDGTPFELARSNDIFGLQQAMLHQLGIVPSGLAETALASQFLEGALRLASTGAFYVDSGAANVYVLTQFGSIQKRVAYYDGMEIVFKATNANTGAATVDVDLIGAVAVTRSDGTALTGGEIGANQFVSGRYNLASNRVELGATSSPASQAAVNAGANATDFVTSLTLAKKTNSLVAGGVFGANPAVVNNSFGVSSIVRTGAGIWLVTLGNTLANTDFIVNTGNGSAGDGIIEENVAARTTTTLELQFHTRSTGALFDAPAQSIQFSVIGELV